MAGTAKFSELQDAIEAGLENLRKWYRRTDDTDVYFICLGKRCVKWQVALLTRVPALDLNWKLAYAEEKWDKVFFDARLERLNQVVCIG